MKSSRVFELCCNRSTITVIVNGQSGTGKPILLAELTRHLREIGFTVKLEDSDDESIVVSKSVNAHE